MSDQDQQRIKINAQVFDAPGTKQGSSRFDSSQVQAEQPTTLKVEPEHRWWHSQFNLMLSVFGLLVMAALLFVTLTPPPLNQSKTVVLGNQEGSITCLLYTSPSPRDA